MNSGSEQLCKLREIISDPRLTELEVKRHCLEFLCDKLKSVALASLADQQGKGLLTDYLYIAAGIIDETINTTFFDPLMERLNQ